VDNFRDILRFFAFPLRRIIWPLKRPSFPRNSDGSVYVHVGAGMLRDKRFINVDIQPYKTTHYLSDGRRILMHASSVDVIYASHVLEHFPHRDINSVLSEWARILRTGGEIFISVPDFSKLSRLYDETRNISNIKMFLMGSQGNAFDFHFNIFDENSLSDALRLAGFDDIRFWVEDDYLRFPFEDYAHYEPPKQISLNLKARKTKPL
jgi:predicted SAM-dependent methyltransferase